MKHHQPGGAAPDPASRADQSGCSSSRNPRELLPPRFRPPGPGEREPQPREPRQRAASPGPPPGGPRAKCGRREMNGGSGEPAPGGTQGRWVPVSGGVGRATSAAPELGPRGRRASPPSSLRPPRRHPQLVRGAPPVTLAHPKSSPSSWRTDCDRGFPPPPAPETSLLPRTNRFSASPGPIYLGREGGRRLLQRLPASSLAVPGRCCQSSQLRPQVWVRLTNEQPARAGRRVLRAGRGKRGDRLTPGVASGGQCAHARGSARGVRFRQEGLCFVHSLLCAGTSFCLQLHALHVQGYPHFECSRQCALT